MKMKSCVFLLALGLVLSARAADRTFESAPQRTHLIELFTSEGCSSCPPAEAWLSKLKGEPQLWKDFVPLAFHVDYWDRLGWRDPFASKEWTNRQYEYSTHWGGDSVYTPGFVLDGREWRGLSLPSAASEKPGVLKLSVGDDKVTAEFHPTDPATKELELHLALLGDGSSDVTAGENRGRKLSHDFVVRLLVDKKMTDGRVDFPVESLKNKTGLAIAGWVTASDPLTPVQAVGGWLR